MNRLASRGQLRASILRWALLLVPTVLLLGFVSYLVSGPIEGNAWYWSLILPELTPPPQVFQIVWPVLYALMGLSAALVLAAWGARGRRAALWVFLVQLLVNLAWSPVFFGAHQITAAMVLILILDALVLVTVGLFWRVRWVAGALLLPYLGWILFATVLNWQFVELNPDADGRTVSGAVERISL